MYGKTKSLVLSLLPQDFNHKLKQFIELLIDNSRILFFNEILTQFRRLENEYNEVVEANIFSAFELTERQKISLKEKLERKFNKKVHLACSIDESLIAGIKVCVGDNVTDGSIKRNLEILKNSILNN